MKYHQEEEKDYTVYKYEDNNRCKKEEEPGCSKVIKKDVSLVANVKVKPIVHIPEHEIEVKCVGPVHLTECKKHSVKHECEFCIKQDLFLRIPVHFDAETEVKEKGIVCHPEEHCDEK